MTKNLQEFAKTPLQFVRHFSPVMKETLGAMSRIFERDSGHCGVIVDLDSLAKELGLSEPYADHFTEEANRASPLILGWNLTRPVVVFDDDLADALDTTEDASIPCEKLNRVEGNPVYFYVDRQFKDVYLQGFLVGTRFSKPKRSIELPAIDFYLVVFLDNNKTKPSTFGFDIVPNAFYFEMSWEFAGYVNSNILADLLLSNPEINYGWGGDRKDLASAIFRRLIYYCSDMPDASEARESIPKPRLKRIKKKGLTLFAAERAHVSILGKQFGEEMRAWKARASGQSDDPHRTVRPHIRRAHWHTYLYGPRSAEERERKVLWIPPVFVHSTKPEEQSI